MAFRSPLPHQVPVPSGLNSELLPQPQANLAPPVPSPVSHTEPHALLISLWSRDGQGWCHGPLWALLRDLCGPLPVLSHLFSPASVSPLA